MTKKLLGLVGAALLFTALASASPVSFTEFCGSATVTATSNGQTPTIAPTQVTCAAFLIPAGYTLTDVDLLIANDFSGATIGSTNTLQFSYSTGPGSIYDSLAFTDTISGTGTSSASGGYTSTTGPPPPCTVTGTGQDNFDCDLSVSIASTGSTSFGPVNVTGSATWLLGTLGQSGSEDFQVYMEFTYNIPPSTPEPASLLLIGSGLLGLALVGRRKFRA